MEEMTSKEFKTIIEMVIMIVKSCNNIDEAVEKLNSLSVIKDD